MMSSMDGSLMFGCILIACLLTGIRSQCDIDSHNDIQLSSNGIFSNTVRMGRVEICICTDITDSSTCEWQTVSTGSTENPMSWRNSIVVCRELGYDDVQSPILQNTVQATDRASNNVQIYAFTFNCDGTESALIDCETGSSTSGLTHAADAYVHCQSSVSNGKIRLTGSTTDDSGIVEYYLDSGWRTVCSDGLEETEADLFCRSLGFDSGTATSFSVIGRRGPNIATTPYISSFSCSSTAYYFSSCTTSTLTCVTSLINAAGVVCSLDNTVQDGSVQQFDTGSSYQRVEVFYGGRWGTVCGSSWGSNDGEVACRELGGDTDDFSTSTTTFNSVSSRPIWISGYSCDGSEDTLSDCNRVSNYPVGYFTGSCSTRAGIDCPVDTSGSGGGLSGGGIAGAVVGIVVLFVILSWLFGANNKARRRRAAAARNRANNVVLVQTAATTVTTSTTPDTQTTINPEPVPTPSDPTLTQAPPPAYNEALEHMNVAQPPQYPDEEKKVPYPTASSNNDPAYPSAPPSNNDYQGYPPPTQPPGFGTNPYPPPPPSANPYPPPPPSSNPYPPSVNPYPPPPGSTVPYPT